MIPFHSGNDRGTMEASFSATKDSILGRRLLFPIGKNIQFNCVVGFFKNESTKEAFSIGHVLTFNTVLAS